MANDNKVGILIAAKDEASSTIKNVKGSLNDLGKGAGEINGLSGAFGALGKAAGLAGLAIGAIKVGQAIVELAQLGAQAQRIETSFQTLTQQSGIASDKLLSDLQKASGGTIANTELMLTANRALALGVADSSAELSDLMSVAIARGKALGLSAQQAFSDLVTGIGRMSPLILDNLGIVTGGEAVFEAYAASIGKSTSALSDQEKKQALVNKVIAESRSLVSANAAAGDDAASKIEKVAAAWENIKTTVGEIILPSVEPFLSGLASGLNQLNESLDRTNQLSSLIDARKSIQSGGAVSNDAELYIAAGQAAAGSAATTAQLRQEQASLAAMIMSQTSPALKSFALDAYQVAAANESAAAELAAARNGISLIDAAALDGAAGLSVLEAQAYATGRSLEYVKAAAIGMSQITGQLAAIRQGAIAQLESAALAAVRAGGDPAVITAEYSNAADSVFNMGLAMENTTEAMFGNKVAAQQAVEQYSAGWNELVKSEQEAKKLGKAVGGIQFSKEFSDLASKVSGVLSGALGDIAGINLDEMLPRQDSVSEDARRLADVAVNGFASPWAEYLTTKFPDTIGAAFSGGGDIKAKAAQLLKDFQDGLRPELLDKGKAKELVKRAIIGEQNIKALTDEIARELAAEMGISVQQAQQAATSALGGSTTGATGASSSPKQVSITPVIDTSKLSTTPISIKALIDSITIAEAVKNPQITSTAAIGSIVIAEGVEYPTPIITGGLTIDAVGIRSDVDVPNVTLPIGYLKEIGLFENVVTPNVTLPIGYLKEIGLFENVVTPNVTIPIGYLKEIAVAENVVTPNVTLPIGYLKEIAVAENVIAPNVAIPIGMIAEVVLLASAIMPNVTLPIGYLKEIGLFENVVTPDIPLSGHITYIFPDLPAGSVTESPVSLSGKITYISPDLPAGSVTESPVSLSGKITYISPDLPASITEKPLQLSAVLSPFVNEPSTDNIESVRTFITDSLPIVVVPQISTEGVTTINALEYLESELRPIVTPYLNYLGILPEDLAAAGNHIAGGIVSGIATYNLASAIVGELNKAQVALRENGIVSGHNWGAGFNSGAGEFISGLVATVVALALSNIRKGETKTGAQ